MGPDRRRTEAGRCQIQRGARRREAKGDKILRLPATKLGAHDIAKQGEAKKGEDKPKSEEAEKEAAAKLASSTFLHQAHNETPAIFSARCSGPTPMTRTAIIFISI